ncbi:MAG TPA: substrate-binding domain-containing protein [Ktedonobacterales bacterium]|nr:substrate-binding domain-containing protein [Ktedonobacterales bacterium]
MAERVGQQWGQYRLLQLLGKGSFAEVYLAEHIQVGTRIAIKVFNTNLLEEDIEPFRAEARSIGRLSHLHLVRVLDSGVQGGVPYLVMQYAQGGNLRRRVPQHAPIPPAAILPFVQQAASALQYAHDQGIIHRNVKPENMLLNQRTELLLSDFSVAVLEQKTRYQTTQDAGAAAYMAPEQIRGRPQPASDQYSLGMAVYEWLTGSRPFHGSLKELLTQHLTAMPAPLHERAPQVPPALEEVVMKALAKDPKARFPSVDAFAQAFRASVDGQPQPFRRSTGPSAPMPWESDFSAPPASGALPFSSRESDFFASPPPAGPASRENSFFGASPLSAPPARESTLPPLRESDFFRPPAPSAPPPGSGAASLQGQPGRPRPLPARNPDEPSPSLTQRGGFGSDQMDAPRGRFPSGNLEVQRAGFQSGRQEAEQPYPSRGGPPALRPSMDLEPMEPPRRRNPAMLATLVVLALVVVLVSGLGVLGANGSGPLASLFSSQTSNNPGPGATTPISGANGKNCSKIGVLLPDTNSSSRWEAYDHPLLFQQLEANGFSSNNIDYANANGDANVQENQAKSDLAKGDCILIISAQDSTAAAAIVEAAKQQQVPVIAYDRLIFSDDLNYYVSFNGVEVGKLQGQYIADHYKDPVYGVRTGHNNIAFIDGSPTDNNATLFAEGAHEALDPLIKNGTLKNVYEKFTPNWDPATGKTEIEEALSNTGDNIQLVLSANDDIGGAIVQALQPMNLAGKVLVTGQDATVGGLQRILEGTQAMTVYKPIIKEATAAALLAAAIRDGKDIATLTKGETTKNPKGKAAIPSVLETPIAVDRNNMASTVIADNYVTKAQVCTGLPADTNTSGICS